MFIITEKSGVVTTSNDTFDVRDIILSITKNSSEAANVYNIVNNMAWGTSYSSENYTIECVNEKTYKGTFAPNFKLPIKGGVLDIDIGFDADYPGVDIEVIPEDETDDNPLTRPRVLVEKPKDGKLRALIWDDPNSEDYTKEIILEGEV